MDRPTCTLSFRSAVSSTNGMCATSQPLATLAGIEILKSGGSAADAAIGMLNTLTVVEPFMNGLGGDLFGMYFDSAANQLTAINASGPAPAGVNLDTLRTQSRGQMPLYGPSTVTVPGALAGLDALHTRYGKTVWADLFQPAIYYAHHGFPVSEIIAAQWKSSTSLLKAYPQTAAIYLPQGKAPLAGEVFTNRPLAATLQKIANEGITSFYSGELAKKICRSLNSQGSSLALKDLENFSPQWVEPLGLDYQGCQVFELPPNSQGITVLEMLALLKEFDLAEMGLNTSKYIHTLTEVKKFAFYDRDTRVGDPRFTVLDFDALVSSDRIEAFKKRFDPWRASELTHQSPPSNTVYVVAVDKDRNVASVISSIFDYFGSGIVAGATGILMQNRGSLFSLQPGHPNCLAPGKRPLHTIIPAMVFKDGTPQLAFGVMGGHMQPQGHVQILNNIFLFGLGVQEASDQPRFFHDGNELCLESAISHQIRRELMQRGHKIGVQHDVFGGFQGIWIDTRSGVLVGGSDLRKDGCAIGY